MAEFLLHSSIQFLHRYSRHFQICQTNLLSALFSWIKFTKQEREEQKKRAKEREEIFKQKEDIPPIEREKKISMGTEEQRKKIAELKRNSPLYSKN